METADPARPGSMVSYATILERALAAHAPHIDAQRVRISSGSMRRSDRIRDLLRLPRRRLAREFDVLHLLDGSQAFLLAGLPLARTVVTVHDVIPALQALGRFPVARPGFAARAWVNASLAVIRRARCVCADSTSTAQDVEHVMNRTVDRVVFLSLRRLEPPLEALDAVPPTVVHVGNNGFYKNRTGALRIFKRMLESRDDLHLVMMGPPPTTTLETCARELPEGAVEFMVDPDDEVVDATLASATVMLFPSLYEGFGWPPLEAMQAGCPVVVSDRGSLPEVVGNGAVVVDPDDVQSFADAALRLVNDPQHRAGMIDAGRSRSACFDDVALARTMSELYVGAAC